MVLISFIFWIINYYLSRTSNIMYKLWDINTVTAADFGVEYNVHADNWLHYKTHVLEDPNATNIDLFEFQKYLKHELEKKVWNVPWVVDENEENVSICSVSYAYDNVDVMNKLKERGKILSSGKLDKLDQVD